MPKTSLYRFYGAGDQLLYIGVTSVGPSRWSEHEQHRTWWAMVARSTVEHFDDRAAALAAEKAAILSEQPPHNTQHRLPRPTPRNAVKRRHGSGTVIKRSDGRWAFVARVNGAQKWINVRTEAEAELLRMCHEQRGVSRLTRDKAIAILDEHP